MEILGLFLNGAVAHGAAVSAEARDRLTQFLEFWFFQRFRGLTAKELWRC
jgi:hypothetical protein